MSTDQHIRMGASSYSAMVGQEEKKRRKEAMKLFEDLKSRAKVINEMIKNFDNYYDNVIHNFCIRSILTIAFVFFVLVIPYDIGRNFIGLFYTLSVALIVANVFHMLEQLWPSYREFHNLWTVRSRWEEDKNVFMYGTPMFGSFFQTKPTQYSPGSFASILQRSKHPNIDPNMSHLTCKFPRRSLFWSWAFLLMVILTTVLFMFYLPILLWLRR